MLVQKCNIPAAVSRNLYKQQHRGSQNAKRRKRGAQQELDERAKEKTHVV